MEKPLVSVIMPAYNAESFIEQAIFSVLHQSFPHWELIVIDDASEDNTGLRVKQFQDKRIRYLTTPHIGSPAGVRNVGLKAAQGEFIAFLDADDIYYPHALEMLWKALQNNPSYTSAHGFYTQIDANGNPMACQDSIVQTFNNHFIPPLHHNHSWENILLGYIICNLPAYMIRKQTLERIGLFNEALCGPEDYEFIIRLFLDNPKGVYCLPQNIYQYRIHQQSLTKDTKNIQRLIESHQIIMEEVFQHPQLPKSYQCFKSKAYVEGYHYLARERLIYKQKHLARLIALQAFKNPHIRFIDWFQRCGQLIIRSYLPTGIDSDLRHLRHYIRSVLNPPQAPVSTPHS